MPGLAKKNLLLSKAPYGGGIEERKGGKESH